MKIYSMTATFGKLENQTLTLNDGLNVINRPNEWGKSTWCAFLTAMLYGVDTRERTTVSSLAVKEHYAPWSGSPMAGRIDLHWNGKDITIERYTKSRIPMGEFKAYETASGITVPELTADNCGKMLLGVEKSVFVRTGFVRLADMPVTQDEALRRRLNELVTTGDESGQSDDLAEKLNNLKNKVKLNRSKGLIPQVLAEKAELETKLQQLDTLQTQSQNLQQRQQALSAHVARLNNHKNALAWQAAESRIQKLNDTRQQLNAATAQAEALEKACAELPDEHTLQSQLHRATDLSNQKDALQMEIAMLPAPPAAPQMPANLGSNPTEQAQKDFDAYAALSQTKKPAKALFIPAGLGLCLIAAGIGLFATGHSGIVYLIAGAVISLLATAAYLFKRKAYKAALGKIQVLLDRYAPLSPEEWVPAAESYVNRFAAYTNALAAQEAHRAQLQQRLQQIAAQLRDLPATGGHSAAIEKRRALDNAKREQQHLMQLVQTLESADPLPEKPDAEDTLTLTEAETLAQLSNAELETRQLHNHLGQVQGQMETLGSAAILQAQLETVSSRLARLEQTYAALELAQSTLAQAATDLQRRFAPAIAQKAKAHFARITDGRYDKLALTEDLSLHAAAANEPTLQSSLWRSDGTVDQLYLSLRLAVAEALTPEAPLVLDDALVRFDDTRLAQTMALLKETAATKQVILFTCQTRENQYA